MTIDLHYYENNLGYLVWNAAPNNYYNSQIDSVEVEQDGVKVAISKFPKYGKFTCVPTLKLSQKVVGKRSSLGYFLKDDIGVFEKFREILPIGPLPTDMWRYDEDDCLVLRDDLHGFESCYYQKFSEPEVTFNEVELTPKGKIEISNLFDPKNIKVEFQSEVSQKQVSIDLSYVCTFDDLLQHLVPEFAHDNIPVEISSPNLYKIIRNYIKQNIDGKYATITSDYDFCFTVKKIVAVKPFIAYKYKMVGARGKTKETPYTATTKEIEVFNMTDDKQKYKGYKVLSSMKAKNIQELKDKLQDYLEDLLDKINAPVQECQHCSGTGHVIVGLDHPK